MKESPFQQKLIMVSGNFAKTVNLQICLGIRFKTKEECYNFLQSLANEVFNRLSEVNMKARGLTLKLLVRAEGAPVVISPIKSHNSNTVKQNVLCIGNSKVFGTRGVRFNYQKQRF